MHLCSYALVPYVHYALSVVYTHTNVDNTLDIVYYINIIN